MGSGTGGVSTHEASPLSRRRCIFLAACAVALPAFYRYASGGARAAAPPANEDVCAGFREGVGGEVLCDPEEISRYPFDWAHSDCARLQPLLIVRPRTAEDVALTVKRSSVRGIPLSYRSGGHSYTCDGIKAGSAHIDLRSMKARSLYRSGDAWVASFETGNTFRDLFTTIDRSRFSIVHGACHPVGVGGFYLHGGVHLNSLTALYGFGNETIVNMTVVTASGQVLVLNAHSEHQDLWRGMRRAGSNFGIATSLTVRVFERPEPRMWLFWAELSHDEAIRLFLLGAADPNVQLNLYYVNPPFFQLTLNRPRVLTFQFTLLHGPTGYLENLRRSAQWFQDRGFPLSWYTIAFNAVVPKPDDLTSLGYPHAWRASHGIWPSSSNCTSEALGMLLGQQSALIARERLPSFGSIDCWLTFSRLPGDRLHYEYNCPSGQFFKEHLQQVEVRFAALCPNYVKYRGIPNSDASPQRYFPDFHDLLPVKRMWDPKFLFGPSMSSLRDVSDF